MSDEQRQQRRSSFWRELPLLLGIAIVVAVVVRVFLLQTFYIPSGSMEHTLQRYDRVLVNKFIYHFREPERGEIIVFRAPPEWRVGQTDQDFIKRVIAVGGDHIACCDPQGRLLINGHPLDEPYLYTDANGVPDPAASAPFEAVVPEGRLWVMGDHRSSSGDSMDHYLATNGDMIRATISVDDVVGKAFLRYWPLDRIGGLGPPDTFDRVPDPQSRTAG